MPTIKDVARLANVSTATVSYVLNNSGPVSEATRARVLAAVEELGYRPSIIARSLKGKHTHMLGFVLSPYARQPQDPFFNEFIAALADTAAGFNYHVAVTTTADLASERKTYKDMVEDRRVDGFIIADTRLDDERLAYLIAAGFPFVAFGRPANELIFPYVDVDGYTGVKQAVQYLIDLGHRRIGLIELSPTLVCRMHRRQGYEAALQENDLPLDSELIVAGGLTEEDGYRAMGKLLDLVQPPTAVMAGNDLMAVGAMNAIHDRGLSVPDDVALIGFDDIPLTTYVRPTLSTLRQDFYDIGERVVRMLMALLHDEELTETQVILEPTLIIRESSGGALIKD
ncbi:MAG: LacI family transcriptional regulator [Anaerolineae bacterium]|jgi:DNA-binding LacI/PurR family transcriptional regulator|nr:LacI family transcriptional regulator [Anaerolineae bacterium]MDH7473641.1 LacI family DNA-binding transcriptional regulator [Anaerolineae bacterium]